LVVGGNRYDRSELAGAFGDLGTLVPFVVGYVIEEQTDYTPPLDQPQALDLIATRYPKMKAHDGTMRHQTTTLISS
jgi:hypothetical protein